MWNFVQNWVMGGGIAIVFVLMVAESCGIPFPSEVIMPFAGYLAFRGDLSLTGAIAAGTLGNVAGSLIAYAAASRWGRPLLLGPGRRVGISARHLDLADGWFERHGMAAVLFGRVLPVVRTYISFPAGLAHVEPLRFTALTAVGALPWCAALAVGGYELADKWDRLSGPISKAAIVLAVVALAVVIAWLVRGRRAASGR